MLNPNFSQLLIFYIPSAANLPPRLPAPRHSIWRKRRCRQIAPSPVRCGLRSSHCSGPNSASDTSRHLHELMITNLCVAVSHICSLNWVESRSDLTSSTEATGVSLVFGSSPRCQVQRHLQEDVGALTVSAQTRETWPNPSNPQQMLEQNVSTR